jgi:DHA2 family multidrug resistance protein-like MFS transporter
MSETDGLRTKQRIWVMACILLGVMLATLDGAIANIALPTIGHDFAVSDSATVWVVNSFQLALTICLLPAASVGESLGLKRVYAFGMLVFTIASLACALSPTIDVLVAARLLQGAGSACMSAVGPALVRIIYPRRLIGSGFALIAVMVAVSGAIGPTVAALILSVASWPWLFLVNLPICIFALPLFLTVTPASPRRSRMFDLPGAALNALALGLLITGVAGLGGRAPTLASAEIVASLAAFVLLIRQQSHRAAPLLPLDLMRIPLFALSVGTSACSYTAQILAYVSLPFLFQTVMHRTPVATGLLVTPWPLLVAVAAPVAGRLTARYPAAILGTIGLVVLSLGLLLLALLPTSPADWDIVWRMGICGVGFGFFQTPNNTALMTAGPIERSGAASGMVGMARTIGWSLGSALVALIFELSGPHGTVVCLGVGAAFAAVGAVVSSARRFARP